MFSRHRGWASGSSTTGTVVSIRAHRRSATDEVATDEARTTDRARTVASRAGIHARKDDDDAPSTGAGSRTALLGDDDLRAIEGTYATAGITAVQIVDVFTSRGIKFSEASFRKYVQQGLLPRSKRVGRKGKHRGSLGVYPAKTVRRINAVKQLMADGYTIEEIQGQFLHYTDLIEGVGEHLTALWSRLGDELSRHEDQTVRRELERELGEVHRDGDRLCDRLGELTRRVAAPRTDSFRLTGAAGGAEDLM